MSCATLIERVFDACFRARHCTRLEGGAAEPLYLPASANCEARVLYREDFAASALHETAHWCIAGRSRRQQRDYGYWYTPDGRDRAQQRAFERVERRPQALEWHFAVAADQPFRISLDNLDGDDVNLERFTLAVIDEARALCEQGLPPRALRFRQALAAALGGNACPTPATFSASALAL